MMIRILASRDGRGFAVMAPGKGLRPFGGDFRAWLDQHQIEHTEIGFTSLDVEFTPNIEFLFKMTFNKDPYR